MKSEKGSTHSVMFNLNLPVGTISLHSNRLVLHANIKVEGISKFNVRLVVSL